MCKQIVQYKIPSKSNDSLYTGKKQCCKWSKVIKQLQITLLNSLWSTTRCKIFFSTIILLGQPFTVDKKNHVN